MRITVEFPAFKGASHAVCHGVLPKPAVDTFTTTTVLQIQSGYKSASVDRDEIDFVIENNVVARTTFLLEKMSRLDQIRQFASDPPPPGVSPTPVGFRVRYTDNTFGILFLPPFCWGWCCFHRSEVKGLMGYDWDLTQDINATIDRMPSAECAAEVICNLSADFDPCRWVSMQSLQVPGYDERPETFKGVSLGVGAVGHRMLCERLEQDGYMFVFEAPFFLPNDNRSGWDKRRMDLMVFKNQTALIIEVDGSQHGEYKQRGDDYERDSLIGMHWLKMRRFRNSDIVNNLDQVIGIIDHLLDPRANSSAR